MTSVAESVSLNTKHSHTHTPYCRDTEFSDCSTGLWGETVKEAHYCPVVGIPILPFVLYRNSIRSRKKASSLNSIYEKSRNIPERRSFPAEKK